jgi:uncharacterized membrane protein
VVVVVAQRRGGGAVQAAPAAAQEQGFQEAGGVGVVVAIVGGDVGRWLGAAVYVMEGKENQRERGRVPWMRRARDDGD